MSIRHLFAMWVNAVMEDEDDISQGTGSSSSRGRRRGSRKKLIGRQYKGTRKASNKPTACPATADTVDEDVSEDRNSSQNVSEMSMEDFSDFSHSIMSESVLDTSEPASDVNVENQPGNSAQVLQQKRGKRKKLIGRRPKSSKKSGSVKQGDNNFQSSNVKGDKNFSEDLSTDATDVSLVTHSQEETSESDNFGLWSSMKYILPPPQTGEAPSEISLAVEEATENLISEAVDEEFSADVNLIEDVQPFLEDVEESELCLDTGKDDLLEENPFEVVTQGADCTELLPHSELTVIGSLRLSLLLLLPVEWSVDICKDTLRLTHLSPYEIPVVQKAITWKDGVIRIFVHNHEVPEDNFLWYATKLNDPLNIGEVCDHLFRLANLLLNSRICQGVQSYQQHWIAAQEKSLDCFIEKNFQETGCLRHQGCALVLIASRVCYPCSKLKTNLKNMVWRKKLAKDQKRVNHRFMNRSQLLNKAAQVQSEKRKKEKVIVKLRERVQRLVARQSVNVDQELSDDLANIFSENLSSMTEVQKLFWSEQVKAMAKGKNVRTIRWNPFVIKLALHLQMISPAGYKYMKNFIKLPSERTLYDFTHVVESKEGPQEFIIEDLQKQLGDKSREEHEKFFNLLFDEVSVRSDIVMKKRTGEILGYTNLTSFESEMAAVEAQVSQTDFKLKPATKVLVYMLQGVTNDIRGIVGIYATEAITAAQLYTRTWDLIYRLESNNLKVISLVCDGAPTNKKFFRMHLSLDTEVVDVVYKTWNLAAVGEDRFLFFIVDPPHLLKSLRNCLANSYAHKNSKRLWKNNEDLIWKVIDMLYQITLEDKYKSVKLTRAHVYLTSYSCMKVIYAAQVASNSVCSAIKRLRSDPRLQNYDVDELCQFLLHVNNFFDCVNGEKDPSSARNRDNKFLAPYEDVNDWRFEYLEKDVLNFFRDWKEDIAKRPGKFKKEERDKIFISYESYESLKVTVHGFVGATKFMLSVGAPFVDGRKFNQDKLEQYFGLLRMAGGGKDNLSVAEALQKSQSLHVQGQAARPSAKGNTEVVTSEWLPDVRPILKKGRNK